MGLKMSFLLRMSPLDGGTPPPLVFSVVPGTMSSVRGCGAFRVHNVRLSCSFEIDEVKVTSVFRKSVEKYRKGAMLLFLF